MSEAKKSDNKDPKFLFIGANRMPSALVHAINHSLHVKGLGIIADHSEPNLILEMLKTPMPEITRTVLIHPRINSGPGKTYITEKKPCGHKTAFADQNTADEYLRQIKRTAKLKNQKKFPTHSYLCPHCLAWHLTSKHQTTLESKTLIADLKFDLSEAKRRIAELTSELRKKFPDKANPHPPSG